MLILELLPKANCRRKFGVNFDFLLLAMVRSNLQTIREEYFNLTAMCEERLIFGRMTT